MNKPASYFYDIEMPPPDMPLYVWLILGFLLSLLLLLIVLRVFQQRQAEVLALQELKHLSSLNPYQLAALLREGLQETQLQKVLPDPMLKELDLARYAPAPDVEMQALFAQAEAILQDKISELSSRVLFKRVATRITPFPVRKKIQPIKAYAVFVIDDFTGFVKNLWRRFHG